MLKKILLVSLVSTILFTVNFFFIQKEVYATCYCINPAADNCVCQTSASQSGKNLPYAANFNGVSVLCELAEEANSLFAIKDPVCDARFNNEIVPYCAPVINESWQVTCYGTGFVNTPGNIPGDTGGQVQSWNPNTTVNFNGFSGSGFTQIVTCHANNFCCARSDVSCDDSGTPAFTGTCGPKVGVNDPEHDSACFASSQTGGGAGESRLWFPHTRLIAGMSTLAQSMFNPRIPIDHEEDGSYFDHYYNTAFARNATPEDILAVQTGVLSGIGYDNLGAITTKVTKHQGFDDSVRPFVNLPDNNSSVVVGIGAPAPLFSFGNTSDENPYNDSPFCFIPEDRNNPGDDLMGPKMQAQITYTAQVTYEAHPAPPGCQFDGEFTSDLTYSEWNENYDYNCQQQCCSAICYLHQPPSDDCIWAPNAEEIELGAQCGLNLPGVGDWSGHPYECQIDPNAGPEGNIRCCANSSVECQPDYGQDLYATGSCGTLPDVQFPLDGAQSVVYNKTPHVEYLYQNHLNADDSLWRRFMPRIREFIFEDIPSSTNFSAFASVTSPRASGTTSQVAGGLTSSPTMYFPKIGTLDKYWLKDFQTAIRPFGFNAINPDLPGQSPGTPAPSCSPMTSGLCAPENLSTPFTGDAAAIASGICKIESGGYPYSINNRCQEGVTYDFSIGLFQINLIAHCRGGFGAIDPVAKTCEIPVEPGWDCGDFNEYATSTYPLGLCNQTLYRCIETYLDPVENIAKAYEIYTSWGGWCAWSAAGPDYCDVCNN